ncbi:nucleotidyltransferase domain-containing protein [Candidatus Poseidonia alphae]|uniref:nucleotidyltransferase domain-containing protein n=1 Tax=Candidatus Poseidonia alphae TaxID=1915863 RepID=UPI00230E568A|nr:nucleotidyltransferase domain-containing protein [Candidatus Poseidonia alphae]
MNREICPHTGFSAAQQKQWPLLHSHMLGTLELGDIDAIAPDYLKGLSEEIKASISTSRMSNQETKARDRIYQHLKRNIERKLNGSQLHAFGSTQSRTSLGVGDLDLCLVVDAPSPRKILNKVRNILNDLDMTEIEVIGRAKVPIIKFKDPETGLPIDISVNNELALYNTELIRAYADTHPMVRNGVLSIKYWASSRAINQAFMGTLSSYAWTLLAIGSMQADPQIGLPNLQKNAEPNVLDLDDTYDVGFHSKPVSPWKPNMDHATCFVSFIRRFVFDWPFEHDVVSIRNGGTVSRSEKGWAEGEPDAWTLLPDHLDRRLGEHSMPIEDPFSLNHDLSRVLRPSGYLTIREEVLKAWVGMLNGATWTELSKKEKSAEIQPFDLFADLRDLSMDKVNALHQETVDQLNRSEEDGKKLSSQRRSIGQAIQFALGKRTTPPEGSIEDEETVSTEISESKSQLDELIKKRDELVNNIVISSPKVSETLRQTFGRITEQLDIMNIPQLEREQELVSLFFELQEIHPIAKEVDRLNREIHYIKKPLHGNIKHLNKAEKKIKRNIRSNRKASKSLRREKGRLESWMRIKEGSKKPRRNDRSPKHQPRGPKPSEVKKKMNAGEALSMDDLSTLLQHGGVLNMNAGKDDPRSQRKGKRNKNKSSNYQVRRGQRGQGKKETKRE